MKIFLFSLWFLVSILFFDIMGFLAWSVTGQTPIGNFYMGTITTHLLRLI